MPTRIATRCQVHRVGFHAAVRIIIVALCIARCPRRVEG